MAKGVKSQYACSECGASSPKWQGQCPGCGAWNTLVETRIAAPVSNSRFAALAGSARLQSLAEVEAREEDRLPTGVAEFDRALGGGLVAGGVVLIGGDPGIGKSTLLLQALTELAEQQPVLYVSGEESAQQVALRAKRLALDTQRLKLSYYELGGNEAARGVATSYGALSLYINFINLFQFLLSLFGQRRD